VYDRIAHLETAHGIRNYIRIGRAKNKLSRDLVPIALNLSGIAYITVLGAWRIWSCDLSQCVCDVSESSWPELHEFIFFL
jgi:hypothetical protein